MSHRWIWLLAIPIVYLLFFFRMGAVGLLGPDEPRYASIGREMAVSGDFVTPRLWGEAWFEKPAFLYWLIAAGYRAGLSVDVAPRLPIALLSVLFLSGFFALVRRLYDGATGAAATTILATCAAWIAFSHVAVTDLPLAACFSTAVLLALAAPTGRGRATATWMTAAGVCLGAGMLAKGLVPVVLATPLVWLFRRRWRELAWLYGAAVLVAAPWYVAVSARNGAPFWNEFLWKHHFDRFASDALQHQQPFWFYIPVLLGALFPWTPLLALVPARSVWTSGVNRALVLMAGFGLAFFSASTNKLPGYLLPILPLLSVVVGNAMIKSPRAGAALAGCAVLLVGIPLIAEILPPALDAGITKAPFEFRHLLPALPVALLAAAAWRLPRHLTMALVAAAVALGVAYLKIRTYPVLDERVSARTLWRRVEGKQACVEEIHRAWRYGLNFYSVRPLPACEGEAGAVLRITQEPGEPPRVAATSSPSASSLP
ncbi:MAG: glycosyltransferase family 39 protein [Bryobacteraceae bacterium]|nr:glycosyltransferase family 39 protein [Bryobacteraceae bacterium]